MKVTHQVRAVLLHISLLWESDINVKELGKVAKEDAIEGGGRAAKKELLGSEQLGDCSQVLEGHLPDLGFCVTSDSLQVRPETVFAFCCFQDRQFGQGLSILLTCNPSHLILVIVG